MAVEFPETRVAALHQLATQLIDKRKPGTDLKPLARDLLRGFHDVCTLAGLDRVLWELARAHAVEIADRTDLEDHEPLLAALVARLATIDLDGGGPRNQKARQLADCVIAALELALVAEPDRNILLPDVVRTQVVAAMASVVEIELPKLRDAIIGDARGRVDEAHHASFAKMVAQLDDRGQRLIKLPKVPIDAQHVVEHALFEARNAVIGRIVRTALDRAKVVLERANAEAAGRLDAPITLRATPREVAILRACDARVPKTTPGLTTSLLESLSELAALTFQAPEKPVHPYSASKTFAIGDLIEHPKFGRGAVVSSAGQRIEVEFADGKHTLVHGR